MADRQEQQNAHRLYVVWHGKSGYTIYVGKPDEYSPGCFCDSTDGQILWEGDWDDCFCFDLRKICAEAKKLYPIPSWNPRI